MRRLKVLIWNENEHERIRPEVAAIYPSGIHGAVAGGLAAADLQIAVATMDMPLQGLPSGALDDVDVLVWWGHLLHDRGRTADCRGNHRTGERGHGFCGTAFRPSQPAVSAVDGNEL